MKVHYEEKKSSFFDTIKLFLKRLWYKYCLRLDEVSGVTTLQKFHDWGFDYTDLDNYRITSFFHIIKFSDRSDEIHITIYTDSDTKEFLIDRLDIK